MPRRSLAIPGRKPKIENAGITRNKWGTLPVGAVDGYRNAPDTGSGSRETGYQHEVTEMASYPPPGPSPSGVGRRIEEAVELIEMELRHAIGYMNDAVIPQVRRESISAMRSISDTLRNLADRFERSGSNGGTKGPHS